MLKLKLFLYGLFSSPIGKSILRLFSFGINANLGRGKNEKKCQFIVAITTDAESGYIEKSERRIWQKENPNAFIGYYYGIRNLMEVFERHKIKTTFFLSTQCFSSKGEEHKRIVKEIGNLIRKGHEIGLHLHPDSDFALQEKLGRKFNATSAFFYNYKEKLEMIRTAKEIIKGNLGKNAEKGIVSFRWGNWALDTEGAKALNELGFKIDSSAAPGIKGHLNDTMKYDWSSVNRHYPWKLSVEDYTLTNHNNSRIIEIPIATFSFFGIKLRADPVNSVLLNRAFIEYYNKADRSEKPFIFVIITHSPEATMKDGKETKALRDLSNFISMAKGYKDVEFCSLKEAYGKL